MAPNAVDILLVENNPNDVELTLHALRMSRLTNRIHVVRDGAEALEFLFGTGAYAGRRSPVYPRLILLDLKLPRVGGLEVLRRIKSDPRTRALPVVVLSSSGEERDIVESYALGANSYIVKLIDFDQFTQLIQQLGVYWMVINQAPSQP